MTRCDPRENEKQKAIVRVRLPGIVYDYSVYQVFGKKKRNKVVAKTDRLTDRPIIKPTDSQTDRPTKPTD